jgi:hypothetical protein
MAMITEDVVKGLVATSDFTKQELDMKERID